MSSTNPAQACDAMDRIDTMVMWINIIGGILALYVTLRVHTATKSIWKSFATFVLISLIVGSIAVAFSLNVMKNNPCIQEAMNEFE